jgi:hypothetical protein
MKFIFPALTLIAAMLAQQAQTPAPSPSLRKDSRLYELRIYTAAPGKLEALHARFRNHTMKIFRKHGMEVAGFWGPIHKEDGSEDKLYYLMVFPSREVRDKAWDAFRKDPEWVAARTASEANGKLTVKVESIIMSATDYAPAR